MPGGVVIVGAGTTAYAACTHLRANGYDGKIRIVGDEPLLPYERPPLSKGYMAGAASLHSLQFRPAEWYADNAIDALCSTRVEAVDAVAKLAVLSNGDRIAFDNLLLATGCTPRRLDNQLGDRIACLRSVADADRIALHLYSGAKIAVVGGGFIGAEVAATARQKGAEVTIIEAMDVPMKHALGVEVGNIYTDIHRDHGVRFELDSTLDNIIEGTSGLRLTTSKGVVVDCDFLVVGIGVTPNVEFLTGSGIELDNGVVVDEYAQTNIPGIAAAGDVANHWHPLFERRMRVEHHDNALQQAVTAANNILGIRESYTDVHWVWSDQYDHNLQFAGSSHDCEQIIFRGSVAERKFAVFYLRHGQLKAVLGVNNGREVVAGRRLIAKGARVDPKTIEDPATRLKDCVLAA